MKLAIAGALLVWLHTAPHALAGQDDLLYDELARRWSREHGVEDAKRVDEVLARAFARIEIGLFDVYVPPEALSEARARTSSTRFASSTPCSRGAGRASSS